MQDKEITILGGIVERIGNPLEWSSVDKMLGVSLVSFVFTVFYTVFARYVLSQFSNLPYVHPGNLGVVIRGLDLWAIGWLILSGLGFSIRRGKPENRFYMHAVAQCWWIGCALGSYVLGPFTGPILIVLVCGGMMGGLIDRRAMLWGFAVAMCILALTTFAERLRMIPYAPIFAAPPYDGAHPSGIWLGTGWTIFASITAIVMVLFLYVIDRWKSREDKLALAYRDLSETKDQLVRAESLAAVGSLVTGAAHELRNPLSSSSAILQSLHEELQGLAGSAEFQKEDALEALEMALRGQGRAAQLAEKLYALTDDLQIRKSEGLLGDFVASIRETYPGVKVWVSEDVADLMVAQSLVETIIPHLLENATHAGGETPPELSVSQEGGHLLVVVRDRGCGMDRAEQAEAFKPFYTGEKTSQGKRVGLGLYIVHELVTRMGGNVELESSPGRGTTVSIHIPI